MNLRDILDQLEAGLARDLPAGVRYGIVLYNETEIVSAAWDEAAAEMRRSPKVTGADDDYCDDDFWSECPKCVAERVYLAAASKAAEEAETARLKEGPPSRVPVVCACNLPEPVLEHALASAASR
jgi:hypothetical protein